MQNESSIVKISSFAFTNLSGGTGISNWGFNEKFSFEDASVKVASGFFDYETGWRFVAESEDENLISYLNKVASKTDRRVFFSEFNLVNQEDLENLIELF